MNLPELHRRLTDLEIDAACRNDIARQLRIMWIRARVCMRMLKQGQYPLEGVNENAPQS